MIDVSNSGAYFTALSSSRIGFDWLGKPGPELEAINFHLLLAARRERIDYSLGPGKGLKVADCSWKLGHNRYGLGF